MLQGKVMNECARIYCGVFVELNPTIAPGLKVSKPYIELSVRVWMEFSFLFSHVSRRQRSSNVNRYTKHKVRLFEAFSLDTSIY